MRKKQEKPTTRSSSKSVEGKRAGKGIHPTAVDTSRGFKSTATLHSQSSKPMKPPQIVYQDSSSEDEPLLSSESENGSAEQPSKKLSGSTKAQKGARSKTRTALKSGDHVEEMAADATDKKRYILFLGNLPHSATRDDIMEHFSKRGVPIAELRLLTDKETGKSKGYAFAEFSNAKSMQNALKFHRSKLGGRTINVEVTCGGGGKGDKRKNKIRERNRTMRRKMTVKSGKVIKTAL